MNKTVDIVLATYNGERFLDAFIQSLQQQDFAQWTLLVSDDGSQDQTVPMLHAWAAAEPRIRIVNLERQGGVAANFSKAMEYSNADYILFADQDDIWLPNKVSELVTATAEAEGDKSDTPVLVFSDLTIVTENLTEISPSLYRYRNLDPMRNLHADYLLWFSSVYGCSVGFNRALAKLATPVPCSAIMHDQWFALQAALHGRIVYLDRSFVLYRQHRNNDMGAMLTNPIQKIRRFSWYWRRITNRAIRVKQQLAELGRRDSDREAMRQKNLLVATDLVGRLKFIARYVLPYAKGQVPFSLTFALAFLLSARSPH